MSFLILTSYLAYKDAAFIPLFEREPAYNWNLHVSEDVALSRRTCTRASFIILVLQRNV